MATLEIKKRVKNGILYTNGCIKIENVRFSFPHLDKPYAGKNADEKSKPKYGLVSMLGKTTHKEVKALIDERIAELLKEGKIAKMPMKDKFCRDGDEEKEAVYEGHWIVSSREERKPAVRNRRGELVSEPRDIADLIEGGYWGHVLVRPWLQDNDYGKKVNAGLVGVQHVKDDETFGEGRIDDTDAWADESDADDGDDGMGDDDSDM
jgi:hypothetical protein